MSDEQNQGQEKTEEATPKRQDDAREKGQVGRSRELNTMALLLCSASGFFIFGSIIITNMSSLMIEFFSIRRSSLFDESQIPTHFLNASIDALIGISPLLFLLFLVALIAPISVGGWIFSAKAMAFQWEKLDPIKGLSRVFGIKGLMELLKALAKFVLLAGLAVFILWLKMDELLLLGQNGINQGLVDTANLVTFAFLILSSATILIAGIDVPFQLWQHTKQLKMTKQEVRDEQKETEGKPEVKSQIRSMQQELANRRMLEKVADADVVITNPTHYAVALKYDQNSMSAPRLVAKGVDFMAQSIRQVAKQNKVQTFSSPLLARALYFNTKLNNEIPSGLYLAAAQVLAYIFQLRASQNSIDVAVPDKPANIRIPDEYRTE